MDEELFNEIYSKVSGNKRTGKEPPVGPATYGPYGPDYYTKQRAREAERAAQEGAYKPRADTYQVGPDGKLEPPRRQAGMGDLHAFEATQPLPTTGFYDLRKRRLMGLHAPLSSYLGSWNWRNPPRDEQGNPLGPNGDPLPAGANGWNPKGEPDFGPGISGWLKSWKYKFFNKEDAGEPQLTKPGKITLFGGLRGLTDQQRAAVEKYVPKEVPNVPGIIGAGIQRAEESSPIIGGVGRALSATIGTGLEVLDALDPARAIEQALSVSAVTTEAGRTSTTSPLPALSDTIPLGPFTNTYNSLRYLSTPMSWSERLDDVRKGWEAGRVFYSSIFEPITRAEFMRRLEDGEDPRYIAMELENPVAEIAGRFILDPLNLIGGATRKARDVNWMKEASKEFIEHAPEYDDFFRNLPAMTDEQAAQALTDLVGVHKNARGAAAQRVLDWQTRRGLFDLTAEGARFTGARTLGDTVRNIVQMSGDEAPEFIRGLYLAASDKDDEIAAGLAIIKNAPNPSVLLSDAANTTGLLMRKMVGDKPEKFLKAIQKAQEGGIDEMIELITKKTDKALAGVFPKFHELSKEVFDALPAWRKFAVRADQIMQKTIYRPINSVLNAVYMGWNLPYGVRNLQQNYITIFLDYGPQAALTALREPISATETRIADWLGGVMPTGAAGFGGPAGDLAKSAGGFFKNAPVFKWAEKVERNAAVRMIAHVVDKTMRRLLDKALDTKSLVQAGIDERAARSLKSLVIKHRGNVAKAVDDFVKSIDQGAISTLETFEWISPKDAEFLRNAGKYDEVVQTITDARAAGKTVEETQEAVGKVFKRMLEEAEKRVRREAPTVSRNAIGASGVVASADDLPDDVLKIATDVYEANHASIEAAKGAITNTAKRLSMDGRAEDAASLLERRDSLIAKGEGLRAESARWGDYWVDWLRDLQARFRAKEKLNLKELWAKTGMGGDFPRDMGEFERRFWQEFYFPTQNNRVNDIRREWMALLDAADDGLLKRRALGFSAQADALNETLSRFKQFDHAVQDAILAKDNRRAAIAMAEQYNISTITKAGKPSDKKILRIINGNLPEGVASKFTSLADVPPDVARRSLARHYMKNRGIKVVKEAAAVAEGAPETEAAAETLADVLNASPTPPVSGDAPPTYARAILEQQGGISAMVDRITRGISDEWTRVTATNLDDAGRTALKEWEKVMTSRVVEARAIAMGTANAARDFTLLPYGKKRGIDLVTAYLMPYQFFYSRTYKNWLSRIVQEPEVITGYARYKEALSRIHAGAPDWWKYQVNVQELLGIDTDNPLFLNLEQTLNPMNGLTGVDFNDTRKRATWYAALLDDLSKFGPTIWTPFSWATALAMYVQAEHTDNIEEKADLEEAIPRWMGRLIPQTATLKSVLNLLNLNTVRGNEFDPIVQFFSGGYDVYERRKIGRALGSMVQNGMITPAQAVDAANTQKGTIWEAAADYASDQRAGGQILSFILGTGYKIRTKEDLQIDNFYNDFYRLWEMEDNLSPDEFQQAMNELRDRYPFMDTVLIANKNGLARDRAFAYNVLSRIPPGQKDDIMRAVGLSGPYYELYQKFYDDRGRIDGWKESDRKRFMDAIAEASVILDVPDNATRAEWRAAGLEYKEMERQGIERFGQDTWDKIEFYFGIDVSTAEGRLRRDRYLEANPDLEEALDWRDAATFNTPILSAYYGGIKNVDRYLTGQMYDELRKKYGFGEEIYDQLNALYDEQNQFYKDNPILGEYRDRQDELYEMIDQAVANKYGLDWESKIKQYYALKDAGKEAEAKAFSRANPDMWKANDYQKELEGQLYDQLAAEFGDLNDLFAQEKKLREQIDAFKKSKQYDAYRAELEKKRREVERMILQVAKLLPERESARIRPDIEDPSAAGQAILDTLEPEPVGYSRNELEEIMGRTLLNLLEDHVLRDEELSAQAERALDDLAYQMDVSVDEILAWIAEAE